MAINPLNFKKIDHFILFKVLSWNFSFKYIKMILYILFILNVVYFLIAKTLLDWINEWISIIWQIIDVVDKYKKCYDLKKLYLLYKNKK